MGSSTFLGLDNLTGLVAFLLIPDFGSFLFSLTLPTAASVLSFASDPFFAEVEVSFFGLEIFFFGASFTESFFAVALDSVSYTHLTLPTTVIV